VVTGRDRSVVCWIAAIGAARAQDVMARFGMGRTVAYRRLGELVARGVLRAVRFAVAAPALYVATRDGLAWAGLEDVDPAHVVIATARHWALCAQLAVVLERAEDCVVWGEPWLRAAERDAERPIASAKLGSLPDGRPRLRRPDLVLFPRDGMRLPVAVEVELSVKGGRRLQAICRAWARCRVVSAVSYYAPAEVAGAVSRAVSSVRGEDAIRVLSLERVVGEGWDDRLAA
jgi:hypothetical protein